MKENISEKFIMQMNKELMDIDISLTNKQMDQFFKYYEMMIDWNERVNLTAITEMEEVVTKHFVDSLTLNKIVLDMEEKDYNLIDIGTGAGFPGIPLKIVFPKIKVTLVDSLNKRVKFLNEVISTLELENIISIHGRAEDLGHDNVSRETYDICVSRAVANLATLSEYCLPFVKPGGSFISYKSGKIEVEMNASKGAIKKLSGEVDDIITFKLPNADERSLIKIKKVNKINNKYPRQAGMPGKQPL